MTAYDEHAIRAFEANALDYLLKPFDDDRFYQSLARAREAVRGGVEPQYDAPVGKVKHSDVLRAKVAAKRG